jgi:undecaprenyl-diphosphatase
MRSDLVAAFVLLCGFALVAVVALTVLARRAGAQGRSPRRALASGLAVATALVCCQFVVVGGVLAHLTGGGADGLSAQDGPALHWVVAHREGVGTGFSIVLAVIGGTASMMVLTVVASGILLYLGRWPAALVVAATAALGGLLVITFKPLYGRPRPPVVDQVIHYHGYSLPSGHALGSTVVLGIVAAALYPALSSTRRRIALIAGAAGLAVAVGLSRVYLAAHWLTDVVTGWLLGGAWLAVGVTALALLSDTRYPVERTGQTTTPSRT